MINIDKVLVVEDSVEDQELYRRIFYKIFGDKIDLSFCSTGEEANDFLSKTNPDVILLDYKLPDTNAIEWLDDSGPIDIPVILFSGEGNERVASEAISRGVDDYIPKTNLTEAVLKNAIIKAIENHKVKKELREKTKEINYISQHDPLTGFLNRAGLLQMLEKTLIESEKEQKKSALLFLDLDRFKYINDSMGHQFGDALIKKVSVRIKNVLHEGTIMCRLGGDEFAIIIDEFQKPEEVVHVAQRLIDAFENPFVIEKTKIMITASIGIAIYPDAGDSIGSVLKSANIALHKAKDKGRNQWHYFTAHLQDQAKQRLLIEQTLSQAVKDKKFSLCYQPIFCMETKALIGFESLIRWNDSTFSEIGPDYFIPIAEEMGLMPAIGTWVFQQALSDFKKWHAINSNLYISVNVSPQQLLDHGFLEDAVKLAQEKGVPSENIIIELTETALIKDMKKLRNALEKLKNLGYKISADDFGTGNATLKTISQLPISEIKIDKSFVQEILGDENGKMVRSIIAMAKLHEFSITAEGVENEKQYEFLKKHGANRAQGYYLSRPKTAQKIEEEYISKLSPSS